MVSISDFATSRKRAAKYPIPISCAMCLNRGTVSHNIGVNIGITARAAREVVAVKVPSIATKQTIRCREDNHVGANLVRSATCLAPARVERAGRSLRYDYASITVWLRLYRSCP